MLIDSHGEILSSSLASTTWAKELTNHAEWFSYNQQLATWVADDNLLLTLAILYEKDSVFSANVNLSILMTCILLSVSLIVLFIASISQRSFIPPVYKLNNAMHELSESHFQIRINEQRNDEFGQLFSGFNQMAQHIDYLVNQVYQEHLNYEHAQLKYLQSQINPHFLYNSLNGIYQMIMSESNESAAKMTMFLSQYYRYAAGKGGANITLREEMDNIVNYINVQKMRYGNHINFKLSVPDSLLDTRLPQLILQPIVENAVIHGLEPKADGGHLWITGDEKDGLLILTVEDDGIGIPPEKLKQLHLVLNSQCEDWHVSTIRDRFGDGLYNPHQRLMLYFGSIAGITVTAREGGGTRVAIHIPMQPPE